MGILPQLTDARFRFHRPSDSRVFKVYALFREVPMTEAEVHARAILAAALIQSGSIDVNSANLAADCADDTSYANPTPVRAGHSRGRTTACPVRDASTKPARASEAEVLSYEPPFFP